MSKMEKITVKPGLEIGPTAPPFIVAEVGSNWTSLQDCMDSISQAKLAGASAVKFQAFSNLDLYGVSDASEHPSSLPLTWLPKLKEKCDAVGIEFMCTAFSPRVAKIVDQYVRVHKVASSDVSHVKLLEELNKMNKPVILSIGASNHNDIEWALLLLSSVPVVLMYCVSAYPAREVDLELIKDIGERYHHLVGFSDHTIDVRVIPSQAVKWGAVVIEKHFKLRDFPNSGDSSFALSREEFKLMIDAIKGKRMPQCYTREESDMILKHKRRLIVTRDMAAGEPFQYGVNFGAFRSKKLDDKGLSGFLLNRVEGQHAAQALLAGDSIGPSDILRV